MDLNPHQLDAALFVFRSPGYQEPAGNSDIVPLACGGLGSWTEIRIVAKKAEEGAGTRFHAWVLRDAPGVRVSFPQDSRERSRIYFDKQ